MSFARWLGSFLALIVLAAGVVVPLVVGSLIGSLAGTGWGIATALVLLFAFAALVMEVHEANKEDR